MKRPDVGAKWRASDAGERYALERWSSARRRERDPRLVAELLERHLAPGPALVLDAPCGTGRLTPVLAGRGRYVGLDVSPSMLAQARATQAGPSVWLAGDVRRMPFADSTFDVVVCCRLLHHLEPVDALAETLRELVRVSRGLVLASFWDATSLPAWRRARFGGKPRETRRPIRRRALASLLAAAGADVLGWRHSLRFFTRQAFVAARKRER